MKQLQWQLRVFVDQDSEKRQASLRWDAKSDEWTMRAWDKRDGRYLMWTAGFGTLLEKLRVWRN